MIRPIDIQEKEFSRAVRGYREEEVKAFLDELASVGIGYEVRGREPLRLCGLETYATLSHSL